MQFVADVEANEDGGAADHVRDRRAARPDRVDAGPPLRLCRRPPGADRQRRVRPAAERRLRRRPRLGPPAHAAAASAAAAAVADRPGAGRMRDRACGESRTRASGRRAAQPQHYVSSKLMCWVALDRAAKLAEIRGDRELQATLARDGGRDPRGHPRARRQRARRPPPALRDRRARCLDAAGGDLRVPARRRRAPAQRPCWRSPTS